MAASTSNPSDTGAFDALFKPVEGTSYFRWDHDAYLRSMSPARRRNHDRRHKANRVRFWLWGNVPWMKWPLLSYVYTFWSLLMEEGIRNTMTPRWGGITFSYLNDGIKPSLWHTWMQVMDPGGEYDGIYHRGAPRNKVEADAVAAGVKSE